MKSLKIVLFTIVLSGCSVFGIRSGYDQLGYKVVEQTGEIEIRSYEARLVAEVVNMKDDREAFMSLFRYISGDNEGSRSISMTTPVEVDRKGTEVAMTVPVETNGSPESGVSMRFFLPGDYSLENAPKPKNPSVKIVSLSGATFAVLKYSGFASREKFALKSVELLSLLEKTSWKADGKPTFLGYDPPFAIPFLRRNEVIVKVIRR